MSDEVREASEVLRDAIAMELDGKDFFEQASRKMTRKRSRDMFLGLVAQEERHVEVLSHELRQLEGGRGWSTLNDAKRLSESSPRLSVFMDKGPHDLGLKPDAGELQVIDFGIDVEKKSIEYYQAAGQETKDPNAKEVFSWLVEEESGHLTILQAERDSRSGSGFYYEDMEFTLEKE